MPLAAAITCLFIAAGLGHSPEFSVPLAVILTAILGLEAVSVRLPFVGFFSAAPSLLAVASGLSFFGPRLAAIVGFVGLAVHALARRSPWTEAARHTLPLAMAVATSALLLPHPYTWLAALFVLHLVYELLNYVLLSASLNKDNLSRSVVAKIRPLMLAANAASCSAAFAGPETRWLYLAVLPFLFLLPSLAQDRVFKLGADANLNAVEKAEKSGRKLRATQRELKDQLGSLNLLLKGCQGLTGDLDGQVETRFQQVLENTVPHEAGAILQLQGMDLQPTHTWSPVGLKPIEKGLKDVAGEVLKGGRALKVDDGAETNYIAPFDGVRSLLGFPIHTQEKMVGVVLLAHREAAHFDLEGEALLGVLAVQAGVTIDNSELYRAVLRAKAELERSQAQLIQAEKMNAVGQLAAGVAHELNSPLGAVLLGLEACRDLASTNPQSIPPLIDQALIAVENSRDIINDLLQYAQRSSENEYLDLAELLANCVRFLQPKIAKSGLELQLECDPGLWTFACPKHTRQIVTNLVLNARDASPEGSEIKVTAKRRDSYCLVSVQDRGSGIAKQHQSKVFDPFFTTKEVGQGTGLGLTVSLQLAQAMGGKIEFESVPGKGSKFELFLPYRSPDQA